jgi:hypothetical protein
VVTVEELRDALDEMPPGAEAKRWDDEWNDPRRIVDIELESNELVILR